MNSPDEITTARAALGQQLALHRKAAGYTQHTFAPLTHYGRSTIANVEAGRQNVPRAFWERCDELLRASGVLVAAYDRMDQLVRLRLRRAAEHVGQAPDDEADGLLDSLLGRELPALVGAHRVRRSDTSADGDPDRLLQLFLQLDETVGGDDLYEPMTRHVERLARAVTDRPRPSLLRGLGQLSQMTGWLALDGNRHGAARRYLSTAVHAAHEADNPALAASSLAYMSLQETYRDNPKRAQALATTAVQVAGSSASPLVRTMLNTRLARAHAKLGNQSHSLLALADADRAHAAAGSADEPLWISYVDAIEVAAQSGACYLDLGLHKQAEAALTRAVDTLRAHHPERVRDHVHYLSRLAKCAVRMGDIERACDIGMRAIDLALAIGSSRVLERLAEFDVELTDLRVPAAKEFRERFAALTGSG